MNYHIYCDGGSRGNPGPSGAGAMIKDSNGIVLAEISEYLGIKTNNYAEYSSLLLALEKCIELGINQCGIEVFMDSKLVVEQINGNWKVKSENIKLLHTKITNLLTFFSNVKVSHISRKSNGVADSLANKAMDSIRII